MDKKHSGRGHQKFLLLRREVPADGIYDCLPHTGESRGGRRVVQDAFVKMYRALPSFQFGSKFSTWFYKIVYNTAITAQRKQSVFDSYDDAIATDLTTSEVDSATAILEREDRKEIIARVLKKLPADESLVLNLFYLEECSIADIGQITDLTPSNIKVKLFRGRKHFYETLQLMMKNETANVL